VNVDREVGWIVDDGLDLVSWAHTVAGVHMNAAGDRVSSSGEMLVVEETDPRWALLPTGRGVEMEGGHRSVEFLPRENKAGCLMFWVEVEPGVALPMGVAAAWDVTSV
jgi:hypothetical protein